MNMNNNNEYPNGAIYNGLEFLRRLVDHHSFINKNGDSLINVYEYQEAVRCLEYIVLTLGTDNETHQKSN